MPNVDDTLDPEPPPEEPVRAVSTDSVPAAERWSWWADVCARELMATRIQSPYASHFHGSLEAVGSHEVQVASVTNSPLTAVRTPLHIRRGDPENYYLVLVHGDPVRIEQERGTACVAAGEMALFSTSHPLTCEFLDFGRPTDLTLVRLPRGDFPLRNGRADRLLGRTLSTRSGASSMLAGYLGRLPQAARTASAPEAAKLAAIAADLAATALAVHLDAQDMLAPETRATALRTRIHAFIDLHLGDPTLGPATIAARHHISVRSLHELFRTEPETVAASIRRRRLERCHADLTDPATQHRTVAEIAARWGFRLPGDLSRAYRAAYGRTPTEARATTPNPSA
ncbi:helix-turn-helix domain-containing protein [Streptomycetaceae bacterium NBC_01309]